MFPRGFDSGRSGDFEKAYPHLARARDLYIELFQTTKPLVRLGYGTNLNKAISVLRLIEGPGEVETYLKGFPFLSFTDFDGIAEDSITIGYLPDKQGFEMLAFRDESVKHLGQGEEGLIADLLTFDESNAIFTDFPEQIAHIGLFKPGSHLQNLHYLVNQLKDGFSDFETNAEIVEVSVTRRIQPETGIYRAAWVDPQTKEECVFEVVRPDTDYNQIIHVGYQLLPTIRDANGTFIPIAKKPNISKDYVLSILG